MHFKLSKKAFRKIKYLSILITLFFFLLFIGNLLIVGSHLNEISPILKYLFYGLIVIAAIYLIALPISDYIRMPKIPPSALLNPENSPNYKTCQCIARGLIMTNILGEKENNELKNALQAGSDLYPLLQSAYLGTVRNNIRQETYKTAKGVLAASALSQNTHLDTLIVIISSLRLIHCLIKKSAYNPGWLYLSKLYINILLTALLIEAIEDIDIGDLFSSLNIISLPGANFVAQSVLNGIGCSFFVLRIGLITEFTLYTEPSKTKNNIIRHNAFKEALPMLKKIIQSVITSMPKDVANTIIKNLEKN